MDAGPARGLSVKPMPTPRSPWLVRALLAAGLALWPSAVSAQEDPDEQANAEVLATADAAFKGWVVRGRPMWVVVALENRAQERTVLLSVGGMSSQRELLVDLARGGRKEVGLLAPTASLGDVKVVVKDAESGERLFTTSARTRLRERSDPVIAYIGARPPGLRAPEERNDGIDAFDLPWEEQRKHTVRTTPRLLPHTWRAYSGIDALYWPAPQWDRLAAPQARALEAWVLAGGHLIVAEDDGWRAVAAHDLARLLPATPTGVDVVEDPAVLSQLLGPSASLGRGFADGEPLLALPKSLPLLAATARPGARSFLSYEEQIPLGWTWALGDGRVSLLRTGIARTGRTPTYDEWLAWTVGRTRPRMPEIYGNLASADEPNLDIHPAALLCLLMLYVLMIGPVDYLVLRHFKRRELTLLTYPAAIVLFSALAWLGMVLSVDASTFLTRTEYVHWHLGPDALEDRPIGSEVAAGTQLRFLSAGYFPTSRQRITIDAPDGFELDGASGANVWQDVSLDMVFRGPPFSVDATASAYALVGVELSQVLPGQATAPIRIVGTDPPVVHNQLEATLTACWMRDGDKATKSLFDLAPGASHTVVLEPIDADGGALYSVWGGESADRQKIVSVAAELEQGADRTGRGEIVCTTDTQTDIPVPGVDPEVTVNHRILRFVF